MFAVIVANLIRYAVAQGGGGNGAVVLHVQGCTREARAVPPARFHWGDACAAATPKTLLAQFHNNIFILIVVQNRTLLFVVILVYFLYIQ